MAMNMAILSGNIGMPPTEMDSSLHRQSSSRCTTPERAEPPPVKWGHVSVRRDKGSPRQRNSPTVPRTAAADHEQSYEAYVVRKERAPGRSSATAEASAPPHGGPTPGQRFRVPTSPSQSPIAARASAVAVKSMLKFCRSKNRTDPVLGQVVKQRSSGVEGDRAPRWHGLKKSRVDLHDTVISVAMSPDDSLMASGTMDKRVTICSTREGGPDSHARDQVSTPIAIITTGGPVSAVVFCAAGRRLVSATMAPAEGVLQLWDVTPLHEPGATAALAAAPEMVHSQTFGGEKSSAVAAMAIAMEGHVLAVVGNGREPLTVYAVSDGQLWPASHRTP